MASSQVDPYSAVAGAVAALYGPLHGGANEAVIRMLTEIGSKDRVPEAIKKFKAGEGRLMGFGHRVYKNYDPRAKIIKQTAYEVFEVTGKNPLIDIALELERIALEDDYFVSRKLYPNVDFYSGIIYQAMGFPVTMFPVLFAIPRTSGWMAQWAEMVRDPEQKIVRPRQIYHRRGAAVVHPDRAAPRAVDARRRGESGDLRAAREVDLDLKSLANVHDPFPLYRWLRDHDPVHRSHSLNGWVVTRYADVLEIFNQPIKFSSDRFRKIDDKYASQRPAVQAVGEILDDWLVFRDPPDHTRLRGLLQKSFTSTQLAKSRGAFGPRSTPCSISLPRAARWTSSRTSPSRCPQR